MRGRDQPADAVDQVGHVAEARQVLGNKRRLPTAEVPVEGILDAVDGSTFKQHLRDMRAADGGAARGLQNPLKVHRDSQALEPRYDGVRTTVAVVPASLQEGLDHVRIEGQEVPEDVELAPTRRDGELASTHHPHAEAFAGFQRLGNP